jgi:DNA polymerase-3 subunit epsilon
MRFIAFDVETTGMVPGVDQIIEIGAVRFLDGQVEAVFSTLIEPNRTIPSGATKVNGITDDMVRGKPKIETLLEPFAEFCEDYFIVAHNASFDAQFLTADIKKYESKAPRGVIIDTIPLARKILPGLPNYKLGTLVQHLKITSTDFHRAEEDATYCGQLFLHLLRRMNLPLNTNSITNLTTLSGKSELRFPQIIRQPKQLNLFDLLH